MATIRTYRHTTDIATDPTGTLVDTETEDLTATGGAISVAVDTTGWSAGGYDITITRQDDGEMESTKSNALPLTVSAAGGIDFVAASQYEGELTDANTSRTATLPAATTAGNFIVVAVSMEDTVDPGFTVTDSSGSNSYRTSASIAVNPGAYETRLYWCENAASASSITIGNLDAWQPCRVVVAEFSGILTSGDPFDQYDVAQGLDTLTTDATPTTTQAGELLIGIIQSGSPSIATSYTAGTNFTLLGTAGSTPALAMEYRIVSSTGTYAASFSTANTGQTFGVGIATFKGA